MIFETERLLVRKLTVGDIQPFYQLESNPKVLQYATGDVKTFSEAEEDLHNLIEKYSLSTNNFWIYTIERKSDKAFVGTLALIKDDNNDDEIGYRFLEKYWKNGYATEICKELIPYCKQIGMTKLIACVVDINVASAKILERFNFKFVKNFISEDIKLQETKYELIL